MKQSCCARIIQVSLSFLLVGLASKLACQAQPTAAEFLPLIASVEVRDETGAPKPNMTVAAVNHEYGFRQSADVDSAGRVDLKVMPGTWSFYAVPTFQGLFVRPGKGYLLAALSLGFTNLPRSVILAPSTNISVRLQSPVFDFAARENYIGFVVEPYGKFVAAMPAGVTVGSGTNLQLWTTVGLSVRSFVSSPRTTQLLYFVEPSRPLANPFTIHVTSQNSGELILPAFTRSNTLASFHMQFNTPDLSWVWSPAILDMPAGATGARLSTNEFFFIRAVDDFVSGQRYRVGLNPLRILVSPGGQVSLPMGGDLSLSTVRTTPRSNPSYVPVGQIIAFIKDGFGNAVREVSAPNGQPLRPQFAARIGGTPIPASGSGDFFSATLPGDFDPATSPSYEISWEFGPWGTNHIVGSLFGSNEQMMAWIKTPRALYQSPALPGDEALRRALAYDDFLEAGEATLGVPVDHEMGIIGNIRLAGFEDEVQSGYKNELPIELNRLVGWPAGDFYLDHEAGHGRIHRPPARFFAIEVLAESYATLLGYKPRSLIFGGEEYLKFLLGNHDLFLRHLHGEPLDAPRIDAMQFVTHYINRQYGWRPHQRFVLEWENSFRELRTHLGQEGFTPREQLAIVYSWLCGANLGPLFETALLDATSSRVDTGLTSISNHLAIYSTPQIRLGTNVTEAPAASIPIELATSDALTTNIQFTLHWDTNKSTLNKISTRDLTLGWSLTYDTTSNGATRVTMSGMPATSGLGTIAQAAFQVRPAASGQVQFMLGQILVNGHAVTDYMGSLTLPPKPIIGSFPNLTDATQAQPYTNQLWAFGGNPPYTWSVVRGGLPSGITLEAASGTVSGAPSEVGLRQFRIRVTDSAGVQGHRQFALGVRAVTPPDSMPKIFLLQRNQSLNLAVTNSLGGLFTLERSPDLNSWSPWFQIRCFDSSVEVDIAEPLFESKQFFRWSDRTLPSSAP